jgi:hypothetical protein
MWPAIFPLPKEGVRGPFRVTKTNLHAFSVIETCRGRDRGPEGPVTAPALETVETLQNMAFAPQV